jgi:hypothetical protein
MATRIELWTDGRLVGGAEQWWDDLLASLADYKDGDGFSTLDPYGDVLFDKEELGAPATEVRQLIPRGAGARPSLLGEARSSVRRGRHGRWLAVAFPGRLT